MFDTICTFPLPADLFAQAVHPSEPLLAVGLSSGHVSTLKLPPLEEDGEVEEEERPKRRGSNGTGFIDTLWQTKRHKGSCRSLGFSLDGSSLYSAGGDGLLKAADTTTGQVTGKVLIPLDSSYSDEDVDAPTVLHELSPQTLILATDSGALHLYDLRDPAPSLPINAAKTAFTKAKPSQTHHPHTDYISSLTPLPPSQTSTSGFSKQFLTTGGTTLALTDIRRGVLVKSEDQEELLLSATHVTGLPAKKSSGSSGEKTLVGGANGVITLWEKGQWDDQEERIYVSADKETVDCLTPMPDGVDGFGKKVAVGLGDGSIRFVRLGRNTVKLAARHDGIEGVIGLDFDVGGRMVSGGGQICKVWREHVGEDDDEDEDAEQSSGLKRAATDSDADSDDDRDSDSEKEEATSRKPKKKRKRGKGQAGGAQFSFAGLD